MDKIRDQMDVQEGINDALAEPLETSLFDEVLLLSPSCEKKLFLTLV